MNKTTFLEELEKELAGIAPDERVAALQYYQEYLDDAGPEREEEVLAELGSPQKIAADIRSSSGEGWTPPEKQDAETQPSTLPPLVPDAPKKATTSFGADAPAAPEPPATQPLPVFIPPQASSAPPPPPPPSYQAGGTPPPPPPFSTRQAPPPPPPPISNNNSTAVKLLLAILFVLFVLPIGGGFLAGLFGVLTGVLVTILVALFIPFILAFAFIVSGIGFFIGSFFLLTVSVANGIFMLGGALILIGLGILFGFIGAAIYRKLLPFIFHTTGSLVRSIAGLIKKMWSNIFGTNRAV